MSEYCPPTLEQITEHQVDLQIHAGDIKPDERPLFLAKVADSYAVPELSPDQQTARDRVLSAMVHSGWANRTHGSFYAQVGWFARISNRQADLTELFAAFAEPIQESGLTNGSHLIGHFMLVEAVERQLAVYQYPSEGELAAQFAIRQEAYDTEMRR